MELISISVCFGREIEEKPLFSAATQWVTELFKFIENVPPFSTTILCSKSRECVGGTLIKSVKS